MSKASIMLPVALVAMLRRASKLDGTGSADIAAELLLTAALAQRPELADYVARKDAALKQVEKDWREAWPDVAARDEMPH